MYQTKSLIQLTFFTAAFGDEVIGDEYDLVSLYVVKVTMSRIDCLSMVESHLGLPGTPVDECKTRASGWDSLNQGTGAN